MHITIYIYNKWIKSIFVSLLSNLYLYLYYQISTWISLFVIAKLLICVNICGLLIADKIRRFLKSLNYPKNPRNARNPRILVEESYEQTIRNDTQNELSQSEFREPVVGPFVSFLFFEPNVEKAAERRTEANGQ